jgi:hypothetical protein
MKRSSSVRSVDRLDPPPAHELAHAACAATPSRLRQSCSPTYLQSIPRRGAHGSLDRYERLQFSRSTAGSVDHSSGCKTRHSRPSPTVSATDKLVQSDALGYLRDIRTHQRAERFAPRIRSSPLVARKTFEAHVIVSEFEDQAFAAGDWSPDERGGGGHRHGTLCCQREQRSRRNRGWLTAVAKTCAESG